MNSDRAMSTVSPASTTNDDIANGFQNLGISISNVNDLQITCFSDVFNDTTLHFQIIRLPKQIYAWIGCDSAKFGHLYAAAPTRPNNTVSVSSLLGGNSDNTGSGIARRIVIKTGVPLTLACNIPKDSPMLEAAAEKKLVQKLNALGYTKSKHQELYS
ncbi:uncharacterized protein LOC111880481 [Lactuca sativa]|uniref:Proteasome assembly chaperone 4 n=1 Tax=Lactuca sativa TaxID=4236 RepID=A0A9R1VCX1_LACSA|nr:uncharacterized protein LOC111880481 [Lactuca sativa]KAJ0202425.1 hypothetical protein LSAT_V11C600325460 [Lactuca sativa]